ncbi:MAG: SDR family oxidoreductase [Tepidisphaeraceae bacterium]
MPQQPVAIVTGASRGVGRAAAIELGRLGYRLTLVSRSESDLKETARLAGVEAIIAQADVTQSQEVDGLVTRTIDRFERIDAVVNNAGDAPMLSIEATTPQLWRRVIDTNLSAPFYLCRACWPAFSEQKSGVVVNISSLAARDPFPGLAAYGAAKAGLNLLGLALASEGADIGVRVHTIALGATETQMFRSLPGMSDFPRDRTLDPSDVARMIGLCIRGELAHTSGEVIWMHKGA